MSTHPSPPSFDALSGFAPNSLPDMLAETIDRFGDRIWLTFGARSWTFAQSGKLIESLAARFQDLGIGSGDRIVLLMPNHPGFVWSYYAGLRLGATIVALNPLYPLDRLNEQIRETAPHLIVGVELEGEKEKVEAVADHAGVARYFWPWDGDALDRYAAGLIADDRAAPQAAVDPGTALAVLQGTGGTTGLPKFAMLTHANLRWNVEQTQSWFSRLKPGEDCLLVPIPLCHITGMTMAMNLAVRLAAETILMPRFTPEAVFELMGRRPVTMLAGVPTIFTALLRHPGSEKIDWSGMKYAAAGGAPAAAETIRRFQALSGVYIMQCYGLSETSPLATVTPGWADDPLGAAGLPVPGTQIMIDGDGERGEILIRGPQVMQGYWNKPEETAHALRDGTLHTGDVGRIDERGFLHIVDRMKEVIIASGYNVYPRLVEDAILTHPAVIEAAVIGAPDAYRGETIRAYVVLHDGASLSLETLQEHLKDRLSPIEIPRQLEIRSNLPLTPVGKPSRATLRQELANLRQAID